MNLDELLLTHSGIHRAFRGWTSGAPWFRAVTEMAAAGAADGLLFTLPGGLTWAHEEGHRAILIQEGIPSLNGANDPPGTWPDGDQVYGVYDDALAGMKAAHPYDFIHFEEAGFETRINTIADLEASDFFFEQDRLDSLPVLWVSLAEDVAYFQVCDQGEDVLAPMIGREGTDQTRRDTIGADCDAWVYDLFRPNEPYAARGPHPLGGIRRDRLPSDLTPEEHDYLHQQVFLFALNALDPAYFGFFRGFPVGDARVEGRILHQVTSFGDAFDLQVLARRGELRGRGLLRLARNRYHLFPALGAELVRMPLLIEDRPLALSLGANLWLQPLGQSFTAADAAPGGSVSLTLHQRFAGPVESFVRVEAKSAGWLPLHPDLGADQSLSVGLTWML